MSELLRSPKGKIGIVVVGGLLLVAAMWFLLVAPQRSKATDLGAQITTSQAALTQRRIELAQPSANVTVKPGDLYRLTKALPNEIDMSGILLDVNRIAGRNGLEFSSIAPSPQVLGTGYLQQPLAVVVQGRFGNVSRFLGDLRSLVSVRRGRLDARGRLYSVSQVDMSRTHRGKDVPGRPGQGDAERLRLQRRGASTHNRPVHDYRHVPEWDGRSRSDPLMAKTTADVAAAKAKKQKIILIVGGVLLLAVAAIQGPKLMKKDSQPAASPAAASESVGVTSTPTGATSTATGAVVVTSSSQGLAKPAGYVAGVALPRATVVRVAPSQLASFTLFEVKDPFVQQAGVESTVGASGQAPSASTQGTTAATGATGAQTAPASTQAAEPLPVVYATINLDGEPQQLKVKQKFPESDPLFVLRSLTKKQAKIGVAGGSFDDGQAVTLQFGKKVTLVNTATGVRYQLKLVYTGATPETIEGFTTNQGEPASADATAGTSSRSHDDGCPVVTPGVPRGDR